MTHSPFGGVMEWVSAEDSARLVANLCEDDVPEQLWGDIYNIGGGDGWRLTNWELQTRMTAAFGLRDVRKWYDRNWFATKNFHGQWYTDSDDLEKLVPFRTDTFEATLQRAVAAKPTMKIAGRIPPWLVKNLILKPLTLKPRGTIAFIRDGDVRRSPHTSVPGRSGRRSAIGAPSGRLGPTAHPRASTTAMTRPKRLVDGGRPTTPGWLISAAVSCSRPTSSTVTSPLCCPGNAQTVTNSPVAQGLSCGAGTGARFASLTPPATAGKLGGISFWPRSSWIRLLTPGSRARAGPWGSRR